MFDLALVLQWVRKNMVELGGDPRRVLIFGNSGGPTRWSRANVGL